MVSIKLDSLGLAKYLAFSNPPAPKSLMPPIKMSGSGFGHAHSLHAH
jgi:hypothetical protein